MNEKEAEVVAVVHCDCYVHRSTRLVGKIVENAAARRSSLCPLLGIPAMAPPIKPGGTPEVKVLHRRIEDESLIEDMYKMGEVLGQGSFGVVYGAENLKSKERLAIKQVNKEKAGSSAVTLLEREVNILKQVKHDHIIRLVEVFETAKKMFLVMELCELGDLKTILFREGPFSEISCKHIVKDLSDAIVYLHKNGIVHRDLKLDNILVAGCKRTAAQDPLFDIRLTDFGLSVVKDGAGSDSLLQSSCGTPVYMAPEVIKHHDYSEQCDQWSIGVILYALLSRQFPFISDKEERLFELIKRAELDYSEPEWENVSGSAKSLLKNLLVADPAYRYTAREVASHPWTTGNADQNASRPPNVLALMKNFARMANTDDPDDLDDDFLAPTDSSVLHQSNSKTSLHPTDSGMTSKAPDIDSSRPSRDARTSSDTHKMHVGHKNTVKKTTVANTPSRKSPPKSGVKPPRSPSTRDKSKSEQFSHFVDSSSVKAKVDSHVRSKVPSSATVSSFAKTNNPAPHNLSSNERGTFHPRGGKRI